MHYSDYLELDKILGAQHPESDRQGQPAHDEMLFIVIHQAYELWFHQLLFETESVIVSWDNLPSTTIPPSCRPSSTGYPVAPPS
jgi:tryptophan 2,3-dioxygenase